MSALATDAVVLAPEAHVAAELVRAIAPAPPHETWQGIPYASTGVVLMVYGEGTARDLPAGTGFVVPRGKAPMTASTWLSNKWPIEAFGTRAVVRSYVGAVGEEDVLEADDADIVSAVARFHAAVVPLPAGAGACRRGALAAIDAAVRTGTPGPGRADPRRRCPRVSS